MTQHLLAGRGGKCPISATFRVCIRRLTDSGLNQFIVDNTNSLIYSGPLSGGAKFTVIQGTATTGVRTAQGFRTPHGTLASTR